MDHYAHAYPIFSRIRGYRRYQKMLSSLRRFDKSEVARQRQRIMAFYDKYGEQATKEAFGADRKVISRWRKKLRQHGGALEGLVPGSTKPNRSRTMTVATEIVQFIRQIRQEHPRLGKEKMFPESVAGGVQSNSNVAPPGVPGRVPAAVCSIDCTRALSEHGFGVPLSHIT